MNKDIKLLGYPLPILDDAILRKIRSGLENEPQLLLQVDTPKVSQKAISNALNSTPGWSTDGATTHDSAGNGIYCLASWGCRITVDTYQHQFRFRILHLDRFGKRDVYAIPLNRVTPPKELPGLSISSDDIKLIFAMADATAGFSNYQERLLTVKHPLQDTVKAHTSYCAFGTLDVNALAALFKGQPDLIAAVAACSDVQLRALKRCRHAPFGLYNFVVPNKQPSIDSWMESVLRPLTFTTDAESNTTGPIIISDSGSSAVTAWANCRGHLAVINSGGMSASNILVDQIQEHIRQCKCQGYTPAPFVVPPITVTSSALCRPEAVDIVLNEKNTPLSTRQSDLLRTAMCSVFRDRAFVSEAYSRWRITMNDSVAYRLDSFRVWRQTIMDCLCKRWFNNDQEIAELFVEEETRQARLANERLRHLSNALAQLADTERFANQICAKPKSVDEAKALLSEQAFAFWHTPKKGDDRGRKFLVFSADSLSRFIAQAECGKELYNAFIKLCNEEEILRDRNYSITLGGKTFNGVAFYADRLEELRNAKF